MKKENKVTRHFNCATCKVDIGTEVPVDHHLWTKNFETKETCSECKTEHTISIYPDGRVHVLSARPETKEIPKP